MQKTRLFMAIGVIALLFAIIPSASAYYNYRPSNYYNYGQGYYDDYNYYGGYNSYYDYSKNIHSDQYRRTVEIRKNSPYQSSYYYSSTDYRPSYYSSYDSWGYRPYTPYTYHRNNYYDYNQNYWNWRY